MKLSVDYPNEQVRVVHDFPLLDVLNTKGGDWIC